MEVYLVGSLSHELLCRSLPDGGDRQHPADVIADDRRRRLIAEFLHRVVLEEGQRMRKHSQRRMTSPIDRLYDRIFVQFLHQGQGQRSVQEVNNQERFLYSEEEFLAKEL